MLGRCAVLGATWSQAASVDDVLASRDSLRRGDKGDAVGHIQRFLGIPEDGKFGKDTEDAVVAFQDAYVTEPHERGVVNAATYRVIAALGPGSRAAPANPPQPAAHSARGAAIPLSLDALPDEVAVTPIWKKVLFAALAAAAALGLGFSLMRRK